MPKWHLSADVALWRTSTKQGCGNAKHNGGYKQEL